MFIYFLLIRIAALFGHPKARLLVRGQRATLQALRARGEQVEDTREVIWFHAASVGEFEQARPIIERLKAQRPNIRIVLTFFSPSGYELRKHYVFADEVYYLPFATRRRARAFVRLVHPTMAIFVKYEFWPAYLHALHKQQVPTYLISAIFRPNQLFFHWWGKSYRRLLTYFTRLFVQDEASRQLLGKYGISQVDVAGDTRFDRVLAVAGQARDIDVVARFVQTPIDMWEDRAPKVIVAGSTWPKDEAYLARYIEEHAEVKLVLVPHEVDEAHLFRIFQLFKGRLVRYSQATASNVHHTRVLLVDAIGFLSSIYRYGQVAYVGGGFGVGIHNTLEPAVYGIPVLFGPNYKHFREAKGLIAAGASRSVKNYHQFAAAMDQALAQHESMGACALAYVQSELGATTHIMQSIF